MKRVITNLNVLHYKYSAIHNENIIKFKLKNIENKLYFHSFSSMKIKENKKISYFCFLPVFKIYNLKIILQQ